MTFIKSSSITFMTAFILWIGRVITYWNKGAERITGTPPLKPSGGLPDNLLNHMTADGFSFA